LRRRFGQVRQKKMAEYLRHNIAGYGTNVFLGLMLAYCGVIGKFFGLPLEVRHVTLSTATLTFGILSIPNPGDHLFVILSAVFGIVVIGGLNFAVSFAASLFVAARARDIRLRNFPFLIQQIMTRYRSGARDFYLPYQHFDKPNLERADS
jgi:site-specific recombinase